MAFIKSTIPWWYAVKIFFYTLFLLFLQSFWVSGVAHPALRIDLLLPLMFGTAIEWPPVVSIAWASLWGFIVDTLSGKFWGFHVGSYVVVVCLVNIAVERFELYNPVYQMLFVGACALGQSVALGLFLLFEAPSQLEVSSAYVSLIARSGIMMVVTPLIAYPVWNVRGKNL